VNKINKYAFRWKVLLENIKIKPFAKCDTFYGNKSVVVRANFWPYFKRGEIIPQLYFIILHNLFWPDSASRPKAHKKLVSPSACLLYKNSRTSERVNKTSENFKRNRQSYWIAVKIWHTILIPYVLLCPHPTRIRLTTRHSPRKIRRNFD